MDTHKDKIYYNVKFVIISICDKKKKNFTRLCDGMINLIS